ncbi:helicase SKI2W-like [Agrilus planipennis]|nr:helicase SKI2W-like [Agrilus planipennis]
MFEGEIEPPPILLDVEKELEEYLINPERLSIHEYERNQEHWPREIDVSSLFVYDISPLSTTLKVQRDYTTGEIVEFCEVPIDSATASSKNSMMLTRAPAAPEDVVFGNISNIPFLPGSFIDPLEQLKYQSETDKKEAEDLLIVPPGFESGLIFDTDGITVKGLSGDNSLKNSVNFGDDKNILDLLDVLDKEQDFTELLEKPENSENSLTQVESDFTTLPGEEEALKDIPVLKISETVPRQSREGTEWAILLDTSKAVDNFKEKVPHLAHNFDFELDTFQKLAIMQLEEHNHVFVAAHTSAGKTVVAEYAIALSQKHMSRTIYTSPIKALSNQKYRDFKRTFKDVGLITGDFQINQTASCLIMTTEILRSMLYRGSDIARDLEYVIFDEVHYINDKERGHVWEQVLIMLPPHVCVVLLSATVPNTTEFADWLGRTHQRKVYVIKTDKRPVPLQHYLYTGCGGKSRDNRYLIQAGNGQFVLAG